MTDRESDCWVEENENCICWFHFFKEKSLTSSLDAKLTFTFQMAADRQDVDIAYFVSRDVSTGVQHLRPIKTLNPDYCHFRIFQVVFNTPTNLTAPWRIGRKKGCHLFVAARKDSKGPSLSSLQRKLSEGHRNQWGRQGLYGTIVVHFHVLRQGMLAFLRGP